MNKLDRITKRFDVTYKRSKQYQETLKTRQAEMFKVFTDELSKKPLARKTVKLPHGLSNQEFDKWMSTHHPGWTFQGKVSLGSSYVVLEEDPAVQRFTYVNPETGRVYGRTVAEGSPTLDDDRLKVEDPELWERISDWPEPWWSLVRGAIASQITLRWSESALDHAASEYLASKNVQRVVKDPNSLSDTDLQLLQPYLSPGPLTVRLVPPRDAKPEELEGNE